MLLFGTIATLRAKRFALAATYLGLSYAVYLGFRLCQPHTSNAAFLWAFSPVNVMVGLLAVTDPATSPKGFASQAAYAALVALLAVPGTLHGNPEAPVFALLVAAPQRHAVEWAVAKGMVPAPPMVGRARPRGGVP